MGDNEIMQLAQELGRELPTLVADDSARMWIESRIADAGSGGITPAELLQELAAKPAISTWLTPRLNEPVRRKRIRFTDALPSHLFTGANSFATENRFSRLPGPNGPVGPEKFVCPTPGCGEHWFAQRAGQQPPLCEKHLVRMVPHQS